MVDAVWGKLIFFGGFVVTTMTAQDTDSLIDTISAVDSDCYSIFNDVFDKHGGKWKPSKCEPRVDGFDRRDGDNGAQWLASLTEWRQKYGDIVLPNIAALPHNKSALDVMREILESKIARFERGHPWVDVSWKGSPREFYEQHPGWESTWTIFPKTELEQQVFAKRRAMYTDPEYFKQMKEKSIGDQAHLPPKGANGPIMRKIWPNWPAGMSLFCFDLTKADRPAADPKAIVYENAMLRQSLAMQKRRCLAQMLNKDVTEVSAADVTRYQTEKFSKLQEETRNEALCREKAALVDADIGELGENGGEPAVGAKRGREQGDSADAANGKKVVKETIVSQVAESGQSA